MLEQIFSFFEIAATFLWTFAGIPALLGLGTYLSYKSNWFQITKLPVVFSNFKKIVLQGSDDTKRGVSPIHTFFASLGGCVGVGNVVSICTAVQIGGPGAVFWVWVAALLGMLVKYGEIYLGVKFREKDNKNGFFGGPMLYLKRVPGGAWLSKIVAVLMCLYGVEIYMFRVMTHSISNGWGISPNIVIISLLILVLGIGKGGVRLVGKMSTVIIPIFLIGFTGMSFWIFLMNFSKIPGMLASIFTHAFTPHAAIGAFAGSSMIITMSHGVRMACYTGDIGVGYAATIHAETSEAEPARQASLGIMDIILDTFVLCTLSMFIILLTGTWNQGISADFVVSEAFSQYFSHVNIIWPLFLFLLGYSSLLAFFAAGRRSAMLLSEKYGSTFYMIFSAIAFLLFSFIGTPEQSLSIMSIVGIMLLVINMYGLVYLKDEISFNLQK